MVCAKTSSPDPSKQTVGYSGRCSQGAGDYYTKYTDLADQLQPRLIATTVTSTPSAPIPPHKNPRKYRAKRKRQHPRDPPAAIGSHRSPR